MADFSGMKLTAKGLHLMALAQAGEVINFARAALGDGVWPENTNPEDLTALMSEKMSLSIQGITTAGGTTTIRCVLTNTGLQAGFFIREIGVFADDPENPGQELLYAVAYAGSPDFLPADSSPVTVEEVIDMVVIVGNAANITAVISDTVVLALKSDIEALRQYSYFIGGS